MWDSLSLNINSVCHYRKEKVNSNIEIAWGVFVRVLTEIGATIISSLLKEQGNWA